MQSRQHLDSNRERMENLYTNNGFKPVQESLIDGSVPQKYVRITDETEYALPITHDPIIDLSLLASSSPEEMEKHFAALSSWGYCQIINHGMTTSFLDDVRQVIKQFFTLPTDMKKNYFIKEIPGETDPPLEGYGNDNAYRQKTLSWNDNMHLHFFPQDKCNFQLWPKHPPTFRTTLREYTTKIKMIGDEILKAMALLLNLKETSFFQLWGNHKDDKIVGRFNFYPKNPLADHLYGLKPHGDGSAITVLLQDKDLEGLQIFKDDKWYKVPLVPEAVVFIVGDQMEIMSNGIFKSPYHRGVVNPQFDRISLAMFFIPSPEKEIGPLIQLCNEDRPQLYKRIKDYAQYFFQSYPDNHEDRSIYKLKINY